MKKYRRTFPIFLFMLIFSLSFVPDSIAQFDDYERNQQLQYLDLGIKQYDNAKYEEADESFKHVLETVKVLPAEVCFYFGANSYHLKKYKQSINWLNKYLALKGTSGQFSAECTEYLRKAEEKFRNESTAVTKQEEVFEPTEEVDYTVMQEVDCGPSGKVICPVCKGQTVIIKKSAMSYQYQSCRYCDEHGYLTCEEYNLLLQGELKPKDQRDTDGD